MMRHCDKVFISAEEVKRHYLSAYNKIGEKYRHETKFFMYDGNLYYQNRNIFLYDRKNDEWVASAFGRIVNDYDVHDLVNMIRRDLRKVESTDLKTNTNGQVYVVFDYYKWSDGTYRDCEET